MTRAQKGQKIMDACLAAQRGGNAVKGIHDMMLWTGMTHRQVWDGINYLRDYATKMGADLISCTRENGSRVYRIGNEAGCRDWAMDRMKYISTAARRTEEIMRAVAQVTGRPQDVNAARQIDRAVTEVDHAIASILAAI
jgi:hypothetical protein